jgi:hypothetical protein
MFETRWTEQIHVTGCEVEALVTVRFVVISQ